MTLFFKRRRGKNRADRRHRQNTMQVKMQVKMPINRAVDGFVSLFRFQMPGVRIPPGGPKQKAPQTAQLSGLWGFFLFPFCVLRKRKTGKKTGKSAYDASQMQVKAAPRTAAFRAVRRPKFFTLFCNTGFCVYAVIILRRRPVPRRGPCPPAACRSGRRCSSTRGWRRCRSATCRSTARRTPRRAR